MFDHSSTLAETLPSIVASVAMEAIGLPYVPTGNVRARRFVERLHRTRLEALRRGQGFTNRAAAGGDLVLVQSTDVGHQIVHAAALNVRHDFVLAV